MILLVAIIVSGIAICLSIFAIRRIRTSRRNRELFSTMTEIATLRKLEIKEWECIGSQILGIDPHLEELIFLDYKNVDRNTLIDLKQIEDCQLILGKFSLQLELTFSSAGRPPLSILFYCEYADRGSSKLHRIRSAKKWRTMIHEVMDRKETEVEAMN